jgi:hypothetical protein
LDEQTEVLELVLDVVYDLLGNNVTNAQATATNYIFSGGDVVAGGVALAVVELFASEEVQSLLATVIALLEDQVEKA